MTLLAIVLFGSLAALVFTFAGYPLVLAAWSRLAPRPVRTAPFEPEVTMVIVAHNAAGAIGRKVANCLAQDYPRDRLRVLVASDGSDDATEHEVAGLGDARASVLAFPGRRGKAACLNDALAACRTEFVVLADVRQALDPAAVRCLMENLADPEVGAASGQLVFLREGITGVGESLDAYWRYEKLIRRDESTIHSSVGVTGALYALRRECFRPIPPQTVLDDVLIPMNVVMQGRRVVFEARAVATDWPSRDLAQERARKVRTLAGNFQLLAAHPGWLAPWRNPVAFQFASHKVLRLLAPGAMAAALASNVALVGEGPLFVTLLVLQLAAYGMAAAGAVFAPVARLLPVKLAMTFFSLNWFVVLGLREFLANPDAHLWSRAPPPPEGSRPAQ